MRQLEMCAIFPLLVYQQCLMQRCGRCQSRRVQSVSLERLLSHLLSLAFYVQYAGELFHLAVLWDSLRCGAYGTYCYGIS